MITRVMPALKRDAMAPMKPVEYAARDGLLIRGYLTLPLGRETGNLPLVMLLHDGPRQRDVWGFDPLVQLLANRGCAVLQINYRGSVGYGKEFSLKGGDGQCEASQQDIEDATRWAIASKIADPKHIAIMGVGFGGNAVLYALGKNPELYSCGVSIGGVSDWAAIFTSQDDPEDKFARSHWLSVWGDSGKLQEALNALSVVNTAGRIFSPLLVIHGRQDRVVPLGQAKRLVAAMERAGRKVDSLFIPNEGHEFCTESGRLAEYKAIEAFLAKHLGTAAKSAVAGSGSGDKKK
jgi:dipeptidyl aminopeptidase/acylaminoacyl peptidase